MLSDKQIVDLMISEPSWEDVIIKIVAEEGIDPWNIDIVKFAGIFMDYLQKAEGLDLRVPARFILVAAVLVRMKSDVLAPKRERNIFIPETDSKHNEALMALASLPPLEPPLKRVPLRNVTLDELLVALKKAFEVKERREMKRERVRSDLRRAVPPPEMDITERVNSLMKDIEEALTEITQEIEFSRLVKHWSRKEIVKTIIPLLQLQQDGKINLDQKEEFKEILVRLRK